MKTNYTFECNYCKYQNKDSRNTIEHEKRCILNPKNKFDLDEYYTDMHLQAFCDMLPHDLSKYFNKEKWGFSERFVMMLVALYIFPKDVISKIWDIEITEELLKMGFESMSK